MAFLSFNCCGLDDQRKYSALSIKNFSIIKNHHFSWNLYSPRNFLPTDIQFKFERTTSFWYDFYPKKCRYLVECKFSLKQTLWEIFETICDLNLNLNYGNDGYTGRKSTTPTMQVHVRWRWMELWTLLPVPLV